MTEDRDCPENFLLGTDFMEKLNAQGDIRFNIARKTLNIGGDEIPFVYSIDFPEENYYVYSSESITLPPRSDNLIIGHINQMLNPEDSFIIEHKLNQYKDLIIGKSIFKPGSTKKSTS